MPTKHFTRTLSDLNIFCKDDEIYSQRPIKGSGMKINLVLAPSYKI